MLHGESTKNSPEFDEHHIVQRLVQRGVEMLSGDDDIWVALDSSDLRKPHATKMPDLMTVRDIDGGAVPGYRLITPGTRQERPWSAVSSPVQQQSSDVRE
jgi:hypothetical protein